MNADRSLDSGVFVTETGNKEIITLYGEQKTITRTFISVNTSRRVEHDAAK